MPLGIGNNLIRNGGGLNPDGLALDLQFAADKTLTARRGPTPVFSRGSSGTFVNANGLIVGKTAGTTASITPSTQAIGSQVTVTVASGSVVGWVVGQAVSLIVDTDGQYDPDATELWLLGNIVSATATQLVFEVTQRTGQSGSATSWTLGSYAPRFDHDPVTLASRGLLIEESRTNLIVQSENHPSISWTKTGVTVAAVTHTAPDGNTSSNLVSEDSSTGLHRLFQGSAYVSGTSYAISVFLKFAGRQFVAITHPAVAANGTAIFDIQNGSVTLQQSGITASMIQHPNGWWRCVVIGTSSTTSTQSHIIQGSTTGGSLTGSYTGLNGSAFYIYGSHVEAGPFATSYIPTTIGTAVRSADVCSIANTSPFWNSSEFTLFTNANFLSSGVDAYASNFNITSGFFGVRRPNTNQAIGIIRSSGVSADIPFGANGSFTTGSMRMALAHSTGQQAGSLNGATAIQQNSAFVPSSNPPFNIGYSGTSAYINGYVLAIRYYRKRLPNAKLQALTV